MVSAFEVLQITELGEKHNPFSKYVGNSAFVYTVVLLKIFCNLKPVPKRDSVVIYLFFLEYLSCFNSLHG